jgi:hypothetical protein
MITGKVRQGFYIKQKLQGREQDSGESVYERQGSAEKERWRLSLNEPLDRKHVASKDGIN